MGTAGLAADQARSEIRAVIDRTGHAVDNGRAVIARLERAFAEGALRRTPFLDQAMGDLSAALDQEEGQRLGGKSAEASRVILRAMGRALDEA